MNIQTVPAYKCEIFIAGDYDKAIASCHRYCDDVGLCVTVTPTKYVFSNGLAEPGVIVGLINYGRFPTNHNLIQEKAHVLGLQLMKDLGQQSFTIQDPHISMWCSDRPEDNPK